MSSVVTQPGVPAADALPQVRVSAVLRRWRDRLPAELRIALGPFAVAVAGAVTFAIVQPDVGDLQAALARAFAARQGVGLGYWFQWFGGGATPGNYSVITPTVSGWIGAATVGAIATVAITVLTAFAVAGTRHPAAATWFATIVMGISLWSGRVPFAVGTAAAVAAVLALRRGQLRWAWAATVVACLASPVTGAFVAFVVVGAFLVEPAHRRVLWPVVAVAGVTLVAIMIVFGSPGTQPYSIWTALLAGGSAIIMLLARPAPAVRVLLWLTLIAAVAFAIIPTGVGSNWNRMPWIWLPPAVVATTTVTWKRWLIAVLPAVIMGAYLTSADIVRSLQPAASLRYYNPLISQLDRRSDLDNHRLEVVQDTRIHTAAFALIGHAALASGYETQEQSRYNAILSSPALDAVSYKLWLDNNAVGYVAFNRRAPDDGPEYRLVHQHRPAYLRQVSSDGNWTLYAVGSPTPIVPMPQRLVSATQAALTIDVPCACTFSVRVRYSPFLQLRDPSGTRDGVVADDGFGWATVRTPAAGRWVLSGSITGPLH